MWKIVNSETGEETILDKDPTTDEQRAQQLANCWQTLRSDRNRLLAECDWTVLADTPTSTAAWKAYRQALRDLPANTTDPFNPVWPTPPS